MRQTTIIYIALLFKLDHFIIIIKKCLAKTFSFTLANQIFILKHGYNNFSIKNLTNLRDPLLSLPLE